MILRKNLLKKPIITFTMTKLWSVFNYIKQIIRNYMLTYGSNGYANKFLIYCFIYKHIIIFNLFNT